MKKVFIQTIPRETAQGMEHWVIGANGTKSQKTKIGFMVNDTFCPMYSSKIGGLATNLDKPWIEQGVQKKDPITQEPLVMQDYYEQRFRKPKGFLHNRPANIRSAEINEKDMSYFENLTIVLNDGTTVLDLDNFDDCMKYEVALASWWCANSEKEWKGHKWPKAQYYIALENESDELKYQKNAIKSNAIAQLHSSELTLSYKRSMIVILKIANARTTLTEAQVHNLLYEYVDASTGTVGTNIDKFMELVNLIKTVKGRIDLDAKFFLQQLLDYRVIAEKQGSYTWMRPTGAIVLGETYTEAIEFLVNPKKQALIEDLRAQLNMAK
jgi:hypothetical protein